MTFTLLSGRLKILTAFESHLIRRVSRGGARERQVAKKFTASLRLLSVTARNKTSNKTLFEQGRSLQPILVIYLFHLKTQRKIHLDHKIPPHIINTHPPRH
jgi:hypothetical protein